MAASVTIDEIFGKSTTRSRRPAPLRYESSNAGAAAKFKASFGASAAATPPQRPVAPPSWRPEPSSLMQPLSNPAPAAVPAPAATAAAKPAPAPEAVVFEAASSQQQPLYQPLQPPPRPSQAQEAPRLRRDPIATPGYLRPRAARKSSEEFEAAGMVARARTLVTRPAAALRSSAQLCCALAWRCFLSVLSSCGVYTAAAAASPRQRRCSVPLSLLMSLHILSPSHASRVSRALLG